MLYNKRPLIYLGGKKKIVERDVPVPTPVYESSISPVVFTQYLNYSPGLNGLRPQRFFISPKATSPLFKLPTPGGKNTYTLAYSRVNKDSLTVIPIYADTNNSVVNRASAMRWLPIYPTYTVTGSLGTNIFMGTCFFICSEQPKVYKIIDTSRQIPDELDIHVVGDNSGSGVKLVKFQNTTAISQIMSELSGISSRGTLFCSDLGFSDTQQSTHKIWTDDTLLAYANNFLNTFYGRKTAVETIDLN